MVQLLRFSEVLTLTGLSRSSLYRLLAAGEFPEPVRVGPKSKRFREDDIQAWIDGRPRGNG